MLKHAVYRPTVLSYCFTSNVMLNCVYSGGQVSLIAVDCTYRDVCVVVCVAMDDKSESLMAFKFCNW